ncbi:MAG: hypothetical protein K2N32_01970 [Clostridia bacterium]|nr:hypothetical protein [Clostridia bacterium]
MKLLWKCEPSRSLLIGSTYNSLNKIIDCNDYIYVPSEATVVNNKAQISYVKIDKLNGSSYATEKIEVFDLPPHKLYYDAKDYILGNKIIKSKAMGGRTIECFENGTEIWKFKHWAYLYTDIIEKDGCIIFGTDGMGSRLYCLDIQTGKVLSETKTHFSAFYDYNGFNWHNGNLVVYGKGSLLILNPFTGEVIDEHKIPTKYLYRSFLQVINNYAYCCVRTNNNQPTVLCFAI